MPGGAAHGQFPKDLKKAAKKVEKKVKKEVKKVQKRLSLAEMEREGLGPDDARPGGPRKSKKKLRSPCFVAPISSPVAGVPVYARSR